MSGLVARETLPRGRVADLGDLLAVHVEIAGAVTGFAVRVIRRNGRVALDLVVAGEALVRPHQLVGALDRRNAVVALGLDRDRHGDAGGDGRTQAHQQRGAGTGAPRFSSGLGLPHDTPSRSLAAV